VSLKFQLLFDKKKIIWIFFVPLSCILKHLVAVNTTTFVSVTLQVGANLGAESKMADTDFVRKY
jgi:hypothetical protein